MPWPEVFIVLLVCHLAGDFLLQTEWQALHKLGGLGRDPERRRALLLHVTTYSLPMLAAFVWIAVDEGAARAVAAGVIVVGTHIVQDDGRLLRTYVRRVKKTDPEFGTPLMIAIDQSFHIIWLFGAALVAAA
jgi:hypothetical protein